MLTNDFNLNKVAQLRGVDVININDLANAMKPVVLPGERMRVRLLKPGEEPGQGVGYLDDGTMVVVEQGRGHLNEEVEFTVTNTRQTSAGKMIFGRMGDGRRRARATPRPQPPPQHGRARSRSSSPASAALARMIADRPVTPARTPFAMPEFAVILPAAGLSTRFGGRATSCSSRSAGSRCSCASLARVPARATTSRLDRRRDRATRRRALPSRSRRCDDVPRRRDRAPRACATRCGACRERSSGSPSTTRRGRWCRRS